MIWKWKFMWRVSKIFVFEGTDLQIEIYKFCRCSFHFCTIYLSNNKINTQTALFIKIKWIKVLAKSLLESSANTGSYINYTITNSRSFCIESHLLEYVLLHILKLLITRQRVPTLLSYFDTTSSKIDLEKSINQQV